MSVQAALAAVIVSAFVVGAEDQRDRLAHSQGAGSAGRGAAQTAAPSNPGAIVGAISRQGEEGPAAGVHVDAVSLRLSGTEPLLTTVATVRSDNQGRFRLSGLAPGQYFVLARDPAATSAGDRADGLRHTATYFPGALAAGEAQPVSVTAGADSTPVDFRLRLVRLASVSGTLGLPDDKRRLLSGAVILVPRESTVPFPLAAEDVEILPDGRFTFRNIPPGKYQIRARAELDPKQPMSFGSFAVEVQERDVDRITIALSPGAVVQGRVEWRPVRSPRPPIITRFRVRAPFADGSSFADSLTGDVGADGRFRLRGVMPGSHFFTIEGLPEPWVVSRVIVRGRDTMFQPTTIAEGEQLHDVRIIVSDVASEVTGSVRDSSGRPVSDALVVAMPQGPGTWSAVNPRYRAIRADQLGRYRVRALPSGSYRVAAVSAVDELAAVRRDWLDGIRARATPLVLASSERRTLNLVAVPAEAVTPRVRR